jgi:hypothetical protein
MNTTTQQPKKPRQTAFEKFLEARRQFEINPTTSTARTANAARQLWMNLL